MGYKTISAVCLVLADIPSQKTRSAQENQAPDFERNNDMKKVIPVFFCVDELYVPVLSVALCSLIENSSPDRLYKAVIIHTDLSQDSMDRLKSLEKPNFPVEFHRIEKGLDKITDSAGCRLRCDYFTLTIFFRLFIPELFPQYDRGIYIDGDVVVKRDIAELFDTPLQGNYLGACRDSSILDVPDFMAYTEKAIGIPRGNYINSGMLLLDMQKLREHKFEEHFLRLLNRYHFDSVAPDQDYINAMCRGNIFYLDDIWDIMPDGYRDNGKEPAIIHYNLFSKPWQYDGILFEKDFWQYAAKSGYLKELTDQKNGFTEQDRAENQECLKNMVLRAKSITEGDNITFVKAEEQGETLRI